MQVPWGSEEAHPCAALHNDYRRILQDSGFLSESRLPRRTNPRVPLRLL